MQSIIQGASLSIVLSGTALLLPSLGSAQVLDNHWRLAQTSSYSECMSRFYDNPNVNDICSRFRRSQNSDEGVSSQGGYSDPASEYQQYLREKIIMLIACQSIIAAPV